MSRRASLPFDLQCRAVGLPVPVAEYRFHPQRRYRFDWAFVEAKLAVEQEGVVYPRKGSGSHQLGGRHVSVTGFSRDVVKYAEAAALGWLVIRVLPQHIRDGSAVRWVEQAIKHRGSRQEGAA